MLKSIIIRAKKNTDTNNTITTIVNNKNALWVPFE